MINLDGMELLVDFTYLDKNIRFLRRQMNLSQEELAARIGLNRGNIASYENGTAEPKVCNLLRLSRLFKVSICDLAQRDLSGDEPAHLNGHALNGHHSAPQSIEALELFRSNALRKAQMIESLMTCSRIKIEQLQSPPPQELQLIIVNLEELYHTARSLMEEHLSLLNSFNSKDGCSEE
jgi:transcriptional regulator with XRE-family HTH domain